MTRSAWHTKIFNFITAHFKKDVTPLTGAEVENTAPYTGGLLCYCPRTYSVPTLTGH
jgi:hypothetical protein